jgi:H+/Cl- antiporter ClcA
MMARLLLLALVLGVLAAAAGSLLMELIHLGETALFTDLPAALGLDGAPWWWAAIVLAVGAGVVLLARRLPGETGQGPLTGFHFDDPLRIVPSVLLAALGTLCFGFVLGPEAPLIVLGTAVGAIVTRRATDQARRAAMMLGGVAAIGSIFGNPFVAAFLILEFAAFGLVPAALLPAVFLALGAGYLTAIGVAGLPGFGVHNLAVPGLPDYDSIGFGDLLWAVLVAVIAAVILVVLRESAVALDRITARRPVQMIVVTWAVTAVALLVADVGLGIDINLILFSGQSGMGELVAETSVGTVMAIVLIKGVAYAAALGGGMRGGPIFPATFHGVGVGLAVSLAGPSELISPLAATGIAAAAAAMIKAPGTSALLGALLVGGSGAAIAPFAIFGAVIGLVVRLAADARLGVTSPPATTPTDPDGAEHLAK